MKWRKHTDMGKSDGYVQYRPTSSWFKYVHRLRTRSEVVGHKERAFLSQNENATLRHEIVDLLRDVVRGQLQRDDRLVHASHTITPGEACKGSICERPPRNPKLARSR